MNIPLFITILISVIDLTKGTKSDEREREKRFVAFPYNSATGVLCALAIPLILPNRNVFMSYNFEANYNMPIVASDLVPGPLDRLEIINRSSGRKNDGANKPSDENSSQKEDENNKSSEEESKIKRSSREGGLITRKKFYKILESKLQHHGHRGRACLLRAICETAADPIHEHNGLIGDIVHIILTPSTSAREDIHQEYYKAEEFGHFGDCRKYKKYCPHCVLDYISKII